MCIHKEIKLFISTPHCEKKGKVRQNRTGPVFSSIPRLLFTTVVTCKMPVCRQLSQPNGGDHDYPVWMWYINGGGHDYPVRVWYTNGGDHDMDMILILYRKSGTFNTCVRIGLTPSAFGAYVLRTSVAEP